MEPGAPGSIQRERFNNAVKAYEKGLEGRNVNFRQAFDKKLDNVKKDAAKAGKIRAAVEAQRAQPPPRDSL